MSLFEENADVIDGIIERLTDEELDALSEKMQDDRSQRLALEVSYSEFTEFIMSRGLEVEFVSGLKPNRAFAVMTAADGMARRALARQAERSQEQK